MDELRSQFRPEFLNRVDEIIIFNSLGPEQIKQIVEIQLTYLKKRLEDRNITLEVTDRAKHELAVEGYDPTYGARPLKRTIQRELENPLAMKILSGEIHDGDNVVVDAQAGEIVFTRVLDGELV